MHTEWQTSIEIKFQIENIKLKALNRRNDAAFPCAVLSLAQRAEIKKRINEHANKRQSVNVILNCEWMHNYFCFPSFVQCVNGLPRKPCENAIENGVAFFATSFTHHCRNGSARKS